MRSCAESGARRAARRALAALACAGALAGAAAPRASGEERSLTLEELMSHMAATPGVRARFHEVKEIALLSEPLTSDGVLYFVPPRRLARFTTSPTESAFVIDGDKLGFHDAAGGDAVDLSQNAVARQVVENFIVLFAGDLPALRRLYELDFHAQGGRWQLGLVPHDPRVRSVVKRLDLRGDGAKLLEMVLQEAEGDRTTTTFADVDVDAHFDEATLARVFPKDGSRPRP